MPVARVIARNPQDCDELCRQLAAAGYTVQFASPDEQFDAGDLIVAAATVHVDFALQYAAEVAQESDAPVIVAPGVVSDAAAVPQTAPVMESPAETPAPLTSRLLSWGNDMRSRWQERRAEREAAKEQKRLQREREAHEAEQRRQEALRARAEEEARISAERERLRLARQAEEEEKRRVAEAERALAAQEAAQIAAEQERLRVQREAEEAERERTRAAQEAARVAAEQERLRLQRQAEEERIQHVAEAEASPALPQLSPAEATASVAPRRAPAPFRRLVRHSRAPRQRQLQRAALLASLVALFAMIGFALAVNLNSHAPLPNSLTNNPVQEESPFGPAHTAAQPARVTHAPARTATPAAPQRPPSEIVTKTKPPAAVPAPQRAGHQTERRSSDDVAQDEVIIHHYVQQKHPPAVRQKRPSASGTSAGIPHYSDQQ